MSEENNEAVSVPETPVASQAAVAPEQHAAAEEAATEKKPRRRVRKKPENESPVADAPAPAAPAAEQATEAVAEKPRRTRRRKTAAPAEGSADTVADDAAVPAAFGQEAPKEEVPAAPRRRRTASSKKAVAAVEEEPTPAEIAKLVDPALRPHRRGRKPKAFIEAEKRAAAELAARRAAEEASRALSGEEPAGPSDDAPAPARRRTQPESPALSADAPDASPQEVARDRGESAVPLEGHAEHAAADQAPQNDVRPGRSRRAQLAAREHGEPSADRGRDRADRRADAPALRRDRSDARADQGNGPHGNRRHQQRQRDERADRAERNDRFDRNDRRQRQQQNGRNNKRGSNRYNGPTEPSVSREDLAALKVAELRERAKEFDLEYQGKKKAELVEEVYTAAARAEGFRDIEGILDITNEGFGYVRAHGYMPSRDDAFVAANMIRAAGLRPGDLVAGTLRPSRQGDKYPGMAKVRSVNGRDPELMRRRPKFSDLTPIYPNERLRMEHGRESITGRAIDIVAPVGKGQRGLIVSPPKAGKTTILKKICQSIAANNPEVHLICLLVDERPEEVTDMQRSIKGDVVASTFDMPADNHTRVSELVIERAKRLVEMGEDVVVVLDSITRLARAYNLAAPASGRILSGGVDSAALYPPKRFLGAARNIENGGSLTILASALVDTGSKMDEVIFEEFKGTGNMELKLDRDLADRRVFPAIDPIQSGTRNEDLLIDENMRPFVWGIRRILANMNNTERAAAAFIKGLKQTNSNEEFLIRSAKKAADHPEAL